MLVTTIRLGARGGALQDIAGSLEHGELGELGGDGVVESSESCSGDPAAFATRHRSTRWSRGPNRSAGTSPSPGLRSGLGVARRASSAW